MFPFTSGTLHFGHYRIYTVADVLARYQQSKLYIGWDSFGLPTENAAKQNGMDCSHWTSLKINQMKLQFVRFNLQIDWSREISTSNPAYYKWTQFIFLSLYHAGLVESRLSIVNWDPVDKTVLANEQIVNGRAERSGALVERKWSRQWFVKTSMFARVSLFSYSVFLMT
jgi:leucyl-tRNA synthetase